MASKSRGDEDLYILAAAYLCSNNKFQKEIAAHLDISQPEVSRLLKKARTLGWLKTTPRLDSPDPDLLDKMRMRFFSSEKLRRRLRELQPRGVGTLRKISIFPSDQGRFSRAGARAVEDALQRATIAGVTWGRTIRELVAELRAHCDRPLRKGNPLQLVPLCGEPLKDRQDPVKCSSSALAAELDELINGNKPSTCPSLAGVPAFIPKGFSRSQIRTIRHFICRVAGYGSVFGEDDRAAGAGRPLPLVHRVDTVITSLGVAGHESRGIFLMERVEFEEITEEQLIESVVGDIGGIIIARRDASEAQKERIRDMNQRWLGIQQDHLLACARKASDNDRPGVIVLAIGRAKAEMVRRIVELSLVNELIIDRELADELEGLA
jgi:DNA-binding transcriptional regulator LsrR (DeoR family)